MLEPTPLHVPLAADASGVLRVGGTRVTLDSVMGAWRQGASAEEIALRFSSVAVEDVYAVIAWALQNPDSVAEYLGRREDAVKALESTLVSRFGLDGLRARLLSRAS